MGLQLQVALRAGIDGALWVIAVFIALSLRLEFEFADINWLGAATLSLTLAILFFPVGLRLGLFTARHPVASFDELKALLVAVLVTSAPISVALFLYGHFFELPRSTVLISAPIFILLSGMFRGARRVLPGREQVQEGKERALIYGAGRMAEVLIPQLFQDRGAGFRPVGLLDDDPAKSKRWISGVKMLGQLKDLQRAVSVSKADALIVCIPRASPELLRAIRDLAMPLGLKILVLPSFSDSLLLDKERVQLQNLGLEDLVGRRSVSVNLARVRGTLAGKRILVTGAGGSIGQELCRQVSRFGPSQLVFLDRDETGLQQAQLVTSNVGLLDSPDIVLADIRDRDVVHEVFEKFQPEVVFHAAALKHLPVLENFPGEAWKTNVLGTQNVLEAANMSGVDHFVNISTDKAADASSVLGRSKRLAEEMTAWWSENSDGTFISVRFGNVFGSRGSLVPTLSYLIENNLPLSITDTEATRYFMSISEACQLVLQASTETTPRSVYVLDMGEPVRIVDIAKRMLELAGKDLPITVTGLRSGEKLHEELASKDEILMPSSHDFIMRLEISSRSPTDVKRLQSTYLKRG